VLMRRIIYLSLLVSSVSSNMGECLMELLHHPVAHVNIVVFLRRGGTCQKHGQIRYVLH
jgi:hypothetical protein